MLMRRRWPGWASPGRCRQHPPSGGPRRPLDADALDAAAGAWAARRTLPPPGARRVIAVDGTTLRGSAAGGEDGRHLPAALDHARGVVLGQAGAGATTGEIPMLPVLLDRIAVGGAVITAGARHAQREHARYLARRGAHYILTVKGNQPGLHAQSRPCPGARCRSPATPAAAVTAAASTAP